MTIMEDLQAKRCGDVVTRAVRCRVLSETRDHRGAAGVDECLVVDRQVGLGAATHAIVVGIGDYPYLLEGSAGQPTEFHDGMGQLTSPPISARLFARWLIESFHHPEKPLATLSLLLAERNPQPFVNPVTGQQYNVPDASLAQVKAAVRKWKHLGDSNADNLLIFFFSGHGISQGRDTSLLLADFGAAPENVLEGAIDFQRLHLAMAQCAARYQVYFVDALPCQL